MIVNCSRVFIARAVLATAMAIFTAACAVRPSPRDSILRRIDAALADQDTMTAVGLLRTRVRDAQSSPEEVIHLARILRSRASVLDRVCAERVLQEGLRKHPDHTDILVELGRTYYDQTFYGDAERTFERVLSIDPDRCEAHYYLALNAYRKWKRVQSYTAYLSTAIDHLRHSQSCAAEIGDGLRMLAFSEYFVGEMTLAAEACSAYASFQPEDPEPLLLLGTIAYDEARYVACGEFFREAMARLGEDGCRDYGDIELFLASDDEKERYRRATPEQKATMQRLYWLDHDPDPTTELNERWLEHVYRVFLSEARFGSDHPPRHGWETQRGKALIKFGPPDEVQSTLKGLKPHAGRMETWTYLQFPQGFSLRFEDEYLGGNYTVPIGDDFSSQVLSESPPLTATTSESTPVAGALDVMAFRDSDTSASIYIAYAADDESLEEGLRTWDIKTFTARTAFFDEEGRPRAYYADTVHADSLPRAVPRGRWPACWAKRFILPFDSYRMSFCLEDERNLTQSLMWAETSTLRYLGGSLALSDILLHTTLAQPANVVIHRGQDRFSVNPRRSFAPSETLHLYVEVYNLSLSDRRCEYEVTYSIHGADTTSTRAQRIGRAMKRLLRIGAPPSAPVSQSFERGGTSAAASEEIAIDIRALPPGDYVLVVSAVDRISGEEARASKSFVKLRSGFNGRGSQKE